MLNPVVLPWPMALALLVALAAAAVIYRNAAAPLRPLPLADATPAPARHRLGAVAAPYRPTVWGERVTLEPAP